MVLTTSTLNRIMVVELALAATLPGFLVTIHHIVQLARPRIGYGSDVGGRRTPWIIGGMFILGRGRRARRARHHAHTQPVLGRAWRVGAGILCHRGGDRRHRNVTAGAAGQTGGSERKPAAAALVWFMMIIGFAVTAGVAGHFLDPYSPERLMTVTSTVSVLAI